MEYKTTRIEMDLDVLPQSEGKEVLMYSNYWRPNVKASKLIQARAVGDDSEGTMVCPRCETRRDGIKHGTQATCESCGLKMEVWGNALCLLPE